MEFDRVLTLSKVDRIRLEDERGFVSGAECLQIFDAFDQEVGQEDFPISFGKGSAASPTSVAYLSFAYCRNAIEGIEHLEQFGLLQSPVSVESVEEEDGTAGFELRARDESLAEVPPRYLEARSVMIVEFIRIQSTTATVPIKVELKAAPSCKELTEFFGVEPVIGARTRFLYKREDLLQSFASHDQRMLDLSRTLLENELEVLKSGALTATLLNYMRETPPIEISIDHAVAKLALSRRTMQRRLAHEGTSFRKLHDLVRKEIATRLLVASDRSISEISYELGFSDPNAFYRAYRSWTGSTPSEVRERSRAQ